jgi:hypothetical protein
MTDPNGHLRVGSVPLGAAKKAAREVRASRGDETQSSPAFFERYLGHFGSSTRQNASKKSGRLTTSAKKAGKASAKKAISRKAGAKKVGRTLPGPAAKKSAGPAKRR